ncbi:hypothetical protein M2158_008951 [Streptomyces sp. SAI-144]|jgi:hypothetical protein|nr:hypothetical protein [Streptomyces sp. SAI-144]
MTVQLVSCKEPRAFTPGRNRILDQAARSGRVTGSLEGPARDRVSLVQVINFERAVVCRVGVYVRCL